MSFHVFSFNLKQKNAQPVLLHCAHCLASFSLSILLACLLTWHIKACFVACLNVFTYRLSSFFLPRLVLFFTLQRSAHTHTPNSYTYIHAPPFSFSFACSCRDELATRTHFFCFLFPCPLSVHSFISYPSLLPMSGMSSFRPSLSLCSSLTNPPPFPLPLLLALILEK